MKIENKLNCKVLHPNTNKIDREEWLQIRKQGLGGSDIGAIFGLNKYKSPMAVYLDKVSDTVEEINSESAYWGTTLEDIVAAEFSKRNNLKIQKRNAVFQHSEYEYMLANVDRFILGEDAEIGVLEVKTASEYVKGQWEENKVPDSYYLQVQHYLLVTGLQWAYIAVLIGGNKYQQYYIERDEAVIEVMFEKEKEFWEEHIVKQIPPDWDGSESSENILKKMYPEALEGTEIILPDEMEEHINAIENLKERQKALDTEIAKHEEVLKAEIGDNEKAKLCGRVITWGNQTRESFDSKRFKSEFPEQYSQFTKPTKYRVFKIK